MFQYQRRKALIENAAVKTKIALVESGGDVTDEDKISILRQAGAKRGPRLSK